MQPICTGCLCIFFSKLQFPDNSIALIFHYKRVEVKHHNDADVCVCACVCGCVLYIGNLCQCFISCLIGVAAKSPHVSLA